MLAENVEIVKRVIDTINEGDLDVRDELITSDFEWVPAMGTAVEGGSYRGREGLETFFGELLDTWQQYRMVADELRDLGDRVLVLGRIEGRGKGSGVPVDAQYGMVCDLRDGRISRVRSYLDQGEALRAAELAE